MMDALPVTIDREKAQELYRAYLTHQHYETPIDEEIRRVYRLIAKGRMIIQALESVKRAGVGADGFPKLAIARADQKQQTLTFHADGSATMSPTAWLRRRSRSGVSKMNFEWPARAFEVQTRANRPWRATAIVPLIPLPQRPKRGLENYHILWEAEWTGAVPFDPMLLRRLGRGDLWLVVAGWDLTEVERAALATRVHA
jgi:hypothetical protein